MNQDGIKELLLKVQDTTVDFTVVMTGKKSPRVNGLYKPDTREILLHNKNFTNDNQMIYTALHEYAHHLESVRMGCAPTSGRCHTSSFWACFHALLERAEEQGLYKIGTEESPQLQELTAKIREKYLEEDGRLMKELGGLLVEAQKLCEEAGIRFEDYIDRVLAVPRGTAKSVMKISKTDVNPAIGFDNMKMVARQSNPEKRKEAENQILSGKSPDTVKLTLAKPPKQEDPRTRIEKEKARLENTIKMLQHRLEQLDESLSQLKETSAE